MQNLEGSEPVDPRETHREFYDQLRPGTGDYWRLMAAPRWRVRTMLKVLEDVRPSRLLDLGCGNGELLREARRAWPGADLWGLDRSAVQIEANRRRYPGMSWEVADFDSPAPPAPGLAGRFDALISLEVIEHVESPARFLSYAFDCALPGGHLLLSDVSSAVAPAHLAPSAFTGRASRRGH